VNAPAVAPRRGVFFGWWVVAGSVVGTALCQSPVVFLTLGVFMLPLGAEFGWDRAQVSFGLSVAAFALALASPFVGRILDRVGARRVTLWSLAGYGTVTAALSGLGDQLWQFYALLVLIGILGAGSNSMSYARVLCAWFDRRRGVALGLTMAGIALGATVTPLIAQQLIDTGGWRVAYAGLGAIVLGVALPVVYGLVRESPAAYGLAPDGDAPRAPARGGGDRPATAPPGLTHAQAVRTPAFWILLFVFFTLALAIHGIQIHLVPLLRDAGIAPKTAAAMAGLMAFTSMLGRVVVGYLFDRWYAPRVGMVAFACTALGFVMLTRVDTVPGAIACALLLGIGASSESDLLAYLTSRYLGLAAFGTLYGYVFGAFMFGTAIGPYAVGVSFEANRSYDLALWICAGGTLAVCGLLALLGPYPDWKPAAD
jgi:MFS family permease